MNYFFLHLSRVKILALGLTLEFQQISTLKKSTFGQEINITCDFMGCGIGYSLELDGTLIDISGTEPDHITRVFNGRRVVDQVG